MRFAIWTVSLLGVAGGTRLAGAESAANTEAFIRLAESSRGDLAFRTAANEPWKVVRRGENLPAVATLRTSATGSCRLELEKGTLQLASETEAQLQASQRQIIVTSGRVFVQSLPGWSVRAGALKGTPAADAVAEFAVGSDQRVSARVLAGTVEIVGERVGQTTLKAGQALAQEKNAAKSTQSDMPPPEIERLRALTEPPRKPQGLGQLVVNDPQSNSPVRLNLARYHVHVVLYPPVALVQIDQSFYNPYPRQQEGTFVFNLPEGASVSRFAMYTTPAQLVEGELIERDKAANIYQSIVNRQRDPAILEQIGGNLFRMRVFPIFARDTKRILLDYTVPIVEKDEGRYTFELPLMSDLEPVWNFSITGAIRGPNTAGTAHSVSHPTATFEPGSDGAVKFALRQRSYRPESAFVLEFQQRPTAEATVRSFVPVRKREPAGEAGTRANEEELDDSTYRPPSEFLATVSPTVLEPDARAQRPAPSPADVLILADTSGGMTDRTRLRQAVRTIADALRAEDRFRLGCVDVSFRPVTKDWTKPGSAAAAAALAQFDREFFLGETDFDESLNAAVNSLPEIDKGRRRVVIYAGDGVLLPGQSFPAASQKRLIAALSKAGARFSAVLIENDPSGGAVMENLAAATEGSLFRAG
ncbi:MAG: VIT domain-containing protein, partial [Deltaproteobacteria bacterium]